MGNRKMLFEHGTWIYSKAYVQENLWIHEHLTKTTTISRQWQLAYNRTMSCHIIHMLCMYKCFIQLLLLCDDYTLCFSFLIHIRVKTGSNVLTQLTYWPIDALTQKWHGCHSDYCFIYSYLSPTNYMYPIINQMRLAK